jgi:hypothetical protein
MGREPSIKRDPIERDPKIAWLVEEAWKEAEAEVAARGELPYWGVCHLVWPVQKRILKEKYGIVWRTPAEMNPEILFD